MNKLKRGREKIMVACGKQVRQIGILHVFVILYASQMRLSRESKQQKMLIRNWVL